MCESHGVTLASIWMRESTEEQQMSARSVHSPKLRDRDRSIRRKRSFPARRLQDLRHLSSGGPAFSKD